MIKDRILLNYNRRADSYENKPSNRYYIFKGYLKIDELQFIALDDRAFNSKFNRGELIVILNDKVYYRDLVETLSDNLVYMLFMLELCIANLYTKNLDILTSTNISFLYNAYNINGIKMRKSKIYDIVTHMRNHYILIDKLGNSYYDKCKNFISLVDRALVKEVGHNNYSIPGMTTEKIERYIKYHILETMDILIDNNGIYYGTFNYISYTDSRKFIKCNYSLFIDEENLKIIDDNSMHLYKFNKNLDAILCFSDINLNDRNRIKQLTVKQD